MDYSLWTDLTYPTKLNVTARIICPIFSGHFFILHLQLTAYQERTLTRCVTYL